MLHFFLALIVLQSTNADPDPTYASLRHDLPWTDDDAPLLSRHVLAFHNCAPSDSPLLETAPYGFDSGSLSEEAAREIFGSDFEGASGECQAACLELGTDRDIAHAVMPHKMYHASKSGETLTEWFEGNCRQVEVCLINYHHPNVAIKTLWLHPDTNEPMVHLDNIKYGESKTRCFSSFIGHLFHIVTSTTNEKIAEFQVEYTLVLAVGKNFPPDNRETRDFDKEIRNTLRHEWDRHLQVKRTFSPLGFHKGRLPTDVFASMRSFFNNNKENKVSEEWGGRGVFVNWWEANCSFIQIPWGLKKMWQRRLLDLVEAWAGVPVEETDMYGLRQYNSGARLLTHVDRISTHSVSLIVNIAQGNLIDPWPVEVHDHADRLHEVPMQPGDIVYYESAKCLHGRNRPLTGKDAYYVNLFTHYRPVGDPKWYEKPNHKGTPDAVLDAQGSCYMQATEMTRTSAGQLGMVHTVHCDDKRLGPYISPGLFTATSGDDLIGWWEQTADSYPGAACPVKDPTDGDELKVE